MEESFDDVTRLVRSLVVELVDNPDDVEVTGSESDGGGLFIEISVDEEDVGKVIGRKGRIIKAIRTLARAAASQEGFRVEVELA